MRLPLWFLWQSTIYWNGDAVGSETGNSSVQVTDSTGINTIQEGKNTTFVYSSTA